ncbi:fimbria/pilus periplasmic chaperone, partial [Enterobacter asburiae]|nr:fimbria/pilus periplasmic chaperone [Enterobacter asburiae]
MKHTLITCAPLCLALMSALNPAIAAGNASGDTRLEQKTTTYSVGLSATRLVYTTGSPGISVTINNPDDFPVPAQSEITAADDKGRAPFSVTPPLFRLDGKQQSRVRVIMTGEPAATDRESLNWLCVTAIPPEKGDAWDNRAD